MYLYTILYSGQGWLDKITFNDGSSLQKMADIAKEYLPPDTGDEYSLECKYAYAIDQTDLIKHFYEVAESLRNHKPSLIRKNQKEMMDLNV